MRKALLFGTLIFWLCNSAVQAQMFPEWDEDKMMFGMDLSFWFPRTQPETRELYDLQKEFQVQVGEPMRIFVTYRVVNGEYPDGQYSVDYWNQKGQQTVELIFRDLYWGEPYDWDRDVFLLMPDRMREQFPEEVTDQVMNTVVRPLCRGEQVHMYYEGEKIGLKDGVLPDSAQKRSAATWLVRSLLHYHEHGYLPATVGAGPERYQAHMLPDDTFGYGYDSGAVALDHPPVTIKDSVTDYRQVWLSTPAMGSDVLRVGLSPTPARWPEGMRVSNGLGYEQPLTPTGDGEATAPLLGLPEGEHEVGVYVPMPDGSGDLMIGLARVLAYASEGHTVHLVPVNLDFTDGQAQTLKRELNAIYAQALVDWTVTLEPRWDDTSWDDAEPDGLDIDGGYSLLSAYPYEAKDLIRAYKRERGTERGHYYLFLVDAFNPGVLGYMPRKRDYGFIFLDNLAQESPEVLYKTVAHELGHGAFRFDHWWEEAHTQPGTTENLMDYGPGVHLAKRQWEYVRNPQWVNTLTEDEEDAMLVSPMPTRCVDQQFWREMRNTSFFNRIGNPVDLDVGDVVYLPLRFYVGGEEQGRLAMISSTEGVYHSTRQIVSKEWAGYRLAPYSENEPLVLPEADAKRAQEVIIDVDCTYQLRINGRDVTATEAKDRVMDDCHCDVKDDAVYEKGKYPFPLANLVNEGKLNGVLDPEGEPDYSEPLENESTLYDWVGLEPTMADLIRDMVGSDYSLVITGDRTDQEHWNMLTDYRHVGVNLLWVHIEHNGDGGYWVKAVEKTSQTIGNDFLEMMCSTEVDLSNVDEYFNRALVDMIKHENVFVGVFVNYLELTTAIRRTLLRYTKEVLEMGEIGPKYWNPNDPEFVLSLAAIEEYVAEEGEPKFLDYQVFDLLGATVVPYLSDKIYSWYNNITYAVFLPVAFYSGLWNGLVGLGQAVESIFELEQGIKCMFVTLIFDKDYREEMRRQFAEIMDMVSLETLSFLYDLLYDKTSELLGNFWEEFSADPGGYLTAHAHELSYGCGIIAFEIVREIVFAATTGGTANIAARLAKGSRFIAAILRVLKGTKKALLAPLRLLMKGAKLTFDWVGDRVRIVMAGTKQVVAEFLDDGKLMLYHVKNLSREGMALEYAVDMGVPIDFDDGLQSRYIRYVQGEGFAPSDDAEVSLIKLANELRDATNWDYTTAKELAKVPAGIRNSVQAIVELVPDFGRIEREALIKACAEDRRLVTLLADRAERVRGWKALTQGFPKSSDVVALLETYGDEIGALATSHPEIAGRICQSAATREGLSAFMDRIEDLRTTAGPETVGKLLDDFSASSTLMRGLVEDPGLVEGWRILFDLKSDLTKDLITLTKLSEDLRLNPDLEFFLKVDEINLNVWNNVFSLSSSARSNVVVLNHLKALQNDFASYNGASWINKRNTLRGHMEGFSNSSGARGGHFIDDVGIGENAHVRILDVNGNDVPITNFPADVNGIRRVEAPNEVHIAQYENVNGVPAQPLKIVRYRRKSMPYGHDFLPPSSQMSWEEVMEQFSSALANPNKVSWGGQTNAFEAVSDGGIIFRWYDNGNGIESFFPKRN